MLFDLDRSEAQDLMVQFEHSPGRCDVNGTSGNIFSVVHHITDVDQRPLGSYVACLCYTGRHAAADMGKVVIKPDDDRLGCIFPITSYREEGLYDNLWDRRFAEVGFRKIITSSIAEQFSTSSVETLRSRTVYPDEIFSDEVSVLVLSKDSLRSSKITLYELELMLIHAGVTIIRAPLNASDMHVNKVYAGNYNIRRLSSYFRAEAEMFNKILGAADRSISDVGAFLTYYQFVEYCISIIMTVKIMDLRINYDDAWTLREKLGNIANEKHRINLLDAEFLNGFDRRVFQDLTNECAQFIRNMTSLDMSDSFWGECLYKTRNLVVHDQLKMYRQGGEHAMIAINRQLRKACLELMTGFAPSPV